MDETVTVTITLHSHEPNYPLSVISHALSDIAAQLRARVEQHDVNVPYPFQFEYQGEFCTAVVMAMQSR